MWLVALYSFLVITALLALASLGVLGMQVRRGVRLGLLLFIAVWFVVNVVFVYAVHRTAYTLESHDPFCISCHLHESEFTRFRDQDASVARDLAGYHWRHGKEFTCLTCHVGEGMDGRARVLFFAGMDVVTYTRGNFRRELEGMKHPLDDASCTKCHPPSNPGAFHRSEKHAGHTTECLSCHLAHARTDEAFGFLDYQRWPAETLQPCLPCHPALAG